MRNRLLFTIALFTGLSALHAQTGFRFAAETGTSCDGASINITSGLSWFNGANGVSDCVDASVSSDELTLTLQSDEPGFIEAFGTNYNPANVLGTTPGEVGYLTITIASPTYDFVSGSTARAAFRLTSGNVDQYVHIDLLSGPVTCPQLVESGAAISLEQMTLFANRPLNDDFTLTYTFTPAVGSVLGEISVSDSDFNGLSYEHTLPAGILNIYPTNGRYAIGLENNTPTAQDINIYKQGGEIIVSGSADIEIQQATSTGDPHNIGIFLDSVGICLGNSEFIVGDGATLTLSEVPVTYQSGISCLGSTAFGKIVVAEGANQQLGERGEGMHLLESGASLVVREGASLTLDCQLYLKTRDGSTFIDLMPGASLSVTGDATNYTGADDGVIVVRKREGATLDLSRAQADVVRLFAVEAVSSTPEVLPAGSYNAFPNPSYDGTVYVQNGSSQTGIAQIDIIDVAGRVAAADTDRQQADSYLVRLPGSGLYTIRVTDIDGNTAYLRVVQP